MEGLLSTGPTPSSLNTTVFVEEPLALPGSANHITGSEEMFFCDLINLVSKGYEKLAHFCSKVQIKSAIIN